MSRLLIRITVTILLNSILCFLFSVCVTKVKDRLNCKMKKMKDADMWGYMDKEMVFNGAETVNVRFE